MSTLELFTSSWEDLWHGEVSEPMGAVYTRPEIVDFILDLAGYSVGASRLATRTVLEPSCGDGAFLTAVLDRLLESEVTFRGEVDWDDATLEQAVCACDIDPASVEAASRLIGERLQSLGCPASRASRLASAWTLHTDFLIQDWDRRFGLVIGNPPYVRLEALPKRVLQRYRSRYTTATDRADLYIPFFERGLELLAPDGVLAFICANRFTRNQYGAALRQLVAQQYDVRHYINLEHTQPFLQDVSAYPAIIVLDRDRGAPTRAATLSDCLPTTLGQVREEALGDGLSGTLVAEFPEWYPGGGPWRSTNVAEQRLIARLEESFPTLEHSGDGTKVGIGVATGADEVFVRSGRDPEIEESRQLPLLMSQDIDVEGIEWSGHYLINPFQDGGAGALVSLVEHPGLAAYLESRADRLRARHVARSRPHAWYRTIDRIWPDLVATPKLVIPDIQPGGVVGIDEGKYYPHHNVYWVTSDSWPLPALQALLRSSIALIQVRALSVQMRGGSLRYQAQTLRRLRVPALHTLPPDLVAALAALGGSTDQAAIDRVASEAYGISGSEVGAVLQRLPL